MSQLFSAQSSRSRIPESNDNFEDFSLTYTPRLTDVTNILKHVMAGNQESISVIESSAKFDMTQLKILPETILAALGFNIAGDRDGLRTTKPTNHRNFGGRVEPALLEDDLLDSIVDISNSEPVSRQQ